MACTADHIDYRRWNIPFTVAYGVSFCSTGTEEITIDPNSQWNPVPIKLDIKEEGVLD